MRVHCSQGDTDCGSDGEREERDDGYMSGAESDSGLVDTRQSMNLVVRNLQASLAVISYAHPVNCWFVATNTRRYR